MTSGSCCTVVVDFYALTFLLVPALSVCSQLLVPTDIPTDTWLLFLTFPLCTEENVQILPVLDQVHLQQAGAMFAG